MPKLLPPSVPVRTKSEVNVHSEDKLDLVRVSIAVSWWRISLKEVSLRRCATNLWSNLYVSKSQSEANEVRKQLRALRCLLG
jgi:hypothetical protein